MIDDSKQQKKSREKEKKKNYELNIRAKGEKGVTYNMKIGKNKKSKNHYSIFSINKKIDVIDIDINQEGAFMMK